MSANDDLVPVLKRLKLSGVLQTLELRIKEAVDDGFAHSEFLYRVLHDEVERREAKQLTTRLHRARFDNHKSIEDFDFHFNPQIPKAKILELATTSFVERRENVLLVGPTGVGKSHIAQALGHRACRAGYTSLYISARELFLELRASRADQTYEKRMLSFTKPSLLVIDDLGLRPLEDNEPVDLYEVIKRRYERSSIVMTSNRSVDEIYPLFGDALLASAAVDRLLHHSNVVTMTGNSYRNPPDSESRG